MYEVILVVYCTLNIECEVILFVNRFLDEKFIDFWPVSPILLLRFSAQSSEWFVRQVLQKFEIVSFMFRNFQRLSVVFLFFAVLSAGVESSKILFAVVFPGKSHWLMFEPIINEVRIYLGM